MSWIRTHAGLIGVTFIASRGEGSVAGHGVRWMAKLGAMVVQTRRQLRSVRRVALQHHVARHQSTLHLVQHELGAELRRCGQLATPNDGGLRLEETDYLVGGRHEFPIQHALLGLGAHLAHHGTKCSS